MTAQFSAPERRSTPRPDQEAARLLAVDRKFALLVQFNWAVVFFSAFYVFVSWAIDFEPGMYIMTLNGLLLLANLRYIAKGGNYTVAANVYLCTNTLVAVAGCTYFSGGLYSPVIPWFAFGPVTATLMLGFNRNTIFWLFVNSACVLVFGVAGMLGVALPMHFNKEYSGFFFAACQIGLVFTLLIHTRIFDSEKNRALGEVETKNTELHVALRDTAQARQKAEEATATKSAFLANMSHEIRTPMNGILGMTELLLQTSLEPRQRELAAAAYASGQTMLHVLNDVLDVSKIEAGKVVLEQVDFDLGHLLDDELALFRATAAATGLKLEGEFDPTLPRRVNGDPTRLRQILTNLLNNAVKFTERGGHVVLSAQRLGADAGQAGTHRLAFEVRDSGIGISEAAQDRLFKPFTQADESTTRRFGGTGLGLAISKELVALMGGTLSVVSTPGAGSTFRVELTLVAAQAVAKDADRPSAAGSGDQRLAGLHLLVAEDNPVNLQVAVAMLEGMGARVDCALDGAQAVAQVRNGHFDALLLDCQMPAMDGYEAARRIRAEGARRLPIIAVTANAMSADRDLCLAAGMNDHLAKPLAREALAAMVLKWTRPPDGVR